MRLRLLQGLLIGALLGGFGTLWAGHRTTGADLIRMHKGGLRDETILDFLRTEKATVVLEGKDLADLAEAGFGDAFVQDLISYTRTQPPAESPGEGRERPRRAAGEVEEVDIEVVPYEVPYPHESWAFPLWFYVGLEFWGRPLHYGPGWGWRYGWGHHPRGHGFHGGVSFGPFRGGFRR